MSELLLIACNVFDEGVAYKKKCIPLHTILWANVPALSLSAMALCWMDVSFPHPLDRKLA